MSELLKISLYEAVGSSICVASDDGQKVYQQLKTALDNDRGVSLSFQNVTVLTAAFLNAAVGQLYGKFSEEKIRSSVKVENIEQDDIALLKRVVDNAKLYFKDPVRYNQAIQDEW